MNESLWKPDDMLEVGLKEPDDFLKVRETLSRIGVASRKDRTLFQSCHILHKQGNYFIVHFTELFALDGKDTNLLKLQRNKQKAKLQYILQILKYTRQCLLVSVNIQISQKQLLQN